MKPVPVCQVCDGAVVPESLHADGATYSCPCGRTRMTVLSEGKLDIVPTDAPDAASEALERVANRLGDRL